MEKSLFQTLIEANVSFFIIQERDRTCQETTNKLNEALIAGDWK